MISRERAQALSSRGLAITVLGLAALTTVYVKAFMFTPVERVQGPAQKIFYVHVPAAWAGLMAFIFTGVLSILYLWLRDRRLDAAAASSAEAGVVFSTVMMTTGPIWGKTVWGTWWTWDARLTFTLLLFMMFVGYLMMRSAVADHDMRARFSAVFGVLGLVLVPFVHMTVYWFRTLHPQPVVLKPTGPTLPGTMLTTLLMSVAAFTVLYLGFVTTRYGVMGLEDARQRELHDDA